MAGFIIKMRLLSYIRIMKYFLTILLLSPLATHAQFDINLMAGIGTQSRVHGKDIQIVSNNFKAQPSAAIGVSALYDIKKWQVGLIVQFQSISYKATSYAPPPPHIVYYKPQITTENFATPLTSFALIGYRCFGIFRAGLSVGTGTSSISKSATDDKVANLSSGTEFIAGAHFGFGFKLAPTVKLLTEASANYNISKASTVYEYGDKEAPYCKYYHYWFYNVMVGIAISI